jgi:hypothetical protein
MSEKPQSKAIVLIGTWDEVRRRSGAAPSRIG